MGAAESTVFVYLGQKDGTDRDLVKVRLPKEYESKSGGKKIKFILEEDCPETLTSPKNFIDAYYLSRVKDKSLDGIIVYYTASANQPENVSYLVEFIDSCDDKSQYVRQDKYSTYWVKQEVNYTDESDVIKKLLEIKKKSDTNDCTTYILEKKENYLCVDVKKTFPEDTKPDSQDGYSKYTHTPKRKSVKPNIVFNLQILKLDGKEFTEKIELLETYFIKNNEKKEDNTPFLVMIKPVPSTSVPAATAVDLIYISMPCDDPKEWKKIGLTSTALKDSLEKIEKIPKQKKATEKIKEKIKEKIRENGKELEKILEKMVDKTFDELRKDACKILDEKAHPPTVPTKPKPGEPVPPKKPEIPTKYELSLSQIIGIIIGAVVFSSVAGTISYGVYWYRTTIMLLT
ncbi:hypothetical protein MACJ_001716 [Theileria orientalis]|uniref:Uncharacterized protein n=1 Tax=Theileria orientalis TaxID=68886 RepID=A0A976M941_THEOR|nr:hypothetical protein MACJ_001716 [Theileria orientalis]